MYVTVKFNLSRKSLISFSALLFLNKDDTVIGHPQKLVGAWYENNRMLVVMFVVPASFRTLISTSSRTSPHCLCCTYGNQVYRWQVVSDGTRITILNILTLSHKFSATESASRSGLAVVFLTTTRNGALLFHDVLSMRPSACDLASSAPVVKMT